MKGFVKVVGGVGSRGRLLVSFSTRHRWVLAISETDQDDGGDAADT